MTGLGSLMCSSLVAAVAAVVLVRELVVAEPAAILVNHHFM